MAQLLGQVAVGTVVKLNESGSPVNYLVVHQGKPSDIYDDSCDGTWLLRQDLIERRVWNSSRSNVLESSDIQSWLNNTLMKYSSDIRTSIKQIKIPYRKNGGVNGVDQDKANGLDCKIFLLSACEVGFKGSASHIPIDGAKLSYFESGVTESANNKRIATLDGEAVGWWLRSPYMLNAEQVWVSNEVGRYGANYTNDVYYCVRPALILPPTIISLDDGTLIYVAPPTNFIYPMTVMQGAPILLTWSAVDGASSYIVQRKIDSGSWTQVYSGSSATFTDTAGSWTTVQYQVCGVFDGTNGAFATSDTINIIPASALVISGEDRNLGTITNDVKYSVASNTGNPISLTRFVNGIQIASLTVESGFSYSIPVLDLPSGNGTIVITATVQSDDGLVTQKRTWQYTKTPIDFPNDGAVGVLSQGGQNTFPVTAAEAVRVSPAWGGSLDKALDFIRGPGSIVKSYPIASGQTVTAGQVVDVVDGVFVGRYVSGSIQMQNVPVGSLITRTENGTPQYYLVVHQGLPSELYDASCNGTWVLRLDIYENAAWDAGNSNVLPGADIFTTMAGMLSLFDAETQAAIKTVKIPYCVGNGQATVKNGADGLECQIFPLAGCEVGFTKDSQSNFPVDGYTLAFFSGLPRVESTKRISNFEGVPSIWYLRSQYEQSNTSVWYVRPAGDYSQNNANTSRGIRPAFILDPTLEVDGYYAGYTGEITTSGTPSQAIALQGGSAGDTIPVIFSGVAQLDSVTQGQKITSTGVQGYGAMDGWLSVAPYWFGNTKIATGSYTGTGTYGSGNKNTITLPFSPKVLFVFPKFSENGAMLLGFWTYGNSGMSGNITDTSPANQNIVSVNGNTISWYCTNAAITQLNLSGKQYFYAALG